MKTSLIVGLDPGAKAGISGFAFDGQDHRFLFCEEFQPKKAREVLRLQKILRSLGIFDTTIVVYEFSVFSGPKLKSTGYMNRHGGMALGALGLQYGTIHDIGVGTWRSFLLGNARVDKQAAIEYTLKMQPELRERFESGELADNAAESYCLCRTYLEGGVDNG